MEAEARGSFEQPQAAQHEHLPHAANPPHPGARWLASRLRQVAAMHVGCAGCVAPAVRRVAELVGAGTGKTQCSAAAALHAAQLHASHVGSG